jgi:hypothetical protein
VAAVTSLPRVRFHLLFVWKCHLSYFLFLRLHPRTTHVLSFLHVQRPGPQFTPPPSHARAAQAHLVPLFCRSLTPSSILFPLMHSLATRLSLRPRATVTPPPWSSSWRQARTRTRRTR